MGLVVLRGARHAISLAPAARTRATPISSRRATPGQARDRRSTPPRGRCPPRSAAIRSPTRTPRRPSRPASTAASPAARSETAEASGEIEQQDLGADAVGELDDALVEQRGAVTRDQALVADP